MESQKRYSFRKYRGVGLASVAIATLFFGLSAGAVQADSLEAPSETAVLALVNEGQEASTDGVSVDGREEPSHEAPADRQGETGQADDLVQPELEQSDSSAMSQITPLESAPEIAYSQGASERLDQVVSDLQHQYGAQVSHTELSVIDKERYEAAVYNEYANHLIENVFPNLRPAQVYSDVPTREAAPLFIQYVQEERRNPVHNGDNQAAVAAAQQRVIEEYNRNLDKEATVEAYAKQAPEVAKTLIQAVVSGQAVSALDHDRPGVFKGLYLLHSQYQFDTELPTLMVTQDPEVTTEPVVKRSALDNLRRIGAYSLRNKTDLAGLLNQNQDLYARRIQPVIGTASQLELVEKRAQNKGQSVGDYLLEHSQANIQLSSQVDKEAVPAWLAANTKLLVPILAQGEGLLVGMTKDSVTLGLVDVYRTADQSPNLASSSRGQAQVVQPELVTVLDDFEHFNTFLRDASRYGQDTTPSTAKPVVFRDSLILINAQNQKVWQTKAIHDTVRNFFAPLGIDSASYNVASNLGGQSEGEQSIVSFGVKVLAKDKQGVTLYSHEMTHSNDERLLFDGTYRGTSQSPTVRANRRQGQGPELYARSLFEAMDNSQTPTSIIRPSFNFNTSITIPSGSGNDTVHQIQPSEALDTVEKLANYQHKLIKLLMWMEAKEAEIALTLPEADRKLYFNQVEQVARTGANAHTASTNDKFIASTSAPTSLEDLVNGSYVTAGYVANGTSRFGEVATNGYHFVPLFDGFYGANFAPAGQNTVGDISFKRNAHEILGWYGFDAMIDYISGRYTSDQEFFAALQVRQAGQTETLSGKVETDPKASKIQQYKELLKLDLQDVSEEIKTIFTTASLTQAIQDDLAVLKAANGNDQVIYNRLTNVRNLKQQLLSELIETTATMTSDPSIQILGETTYDVIYVSNFGTGNGETATTPMKNLKEAIAKVREGGRIVLVDDITERTPVSIDKSLIIEGSQPDKALLLNEDLTITKPVTFKGLRLQLNKSSQETGVIRAQADLVLDGVSTLISPQQEDQRPAIVLSGVGPVALEVNNNRDTKLASVIAETASTMSFAWGVTVVGAVEARTDGVVTVTSQSNFIDQFYGDNLRLTLDNASLGDAVLQVKDLLLTNRATVSLSEDEESKVTDLLAITNGTRLGARTTSLSVKALDGTGVLAFDESATFRAEQALAETDIRVTHNTLAYTDHKTYVTIPVRQAEPTVTLWQRDHALSPDSDGRYTYLAPYELYHDFVAEDDEGPFLPDEVLNLLEAYSTNDGSDPAQRLTRAPEVPAQPTKIKVLDGEGAWEFLGWTVVIEGASQKIYDYKGTWRYVPNPAPTYQATYVFQPETGVTLDLPQGLVDRLIGKNRTDLAIGETVGIEGIDTSTYTDSTNKGRWVFQAWSQERATIADRDVTFTGTWSFVANPTYTARYDFVVASGISLSLPSALTDRLLNQDQSGLTDGASVDTSHIDTSALFVSDGQWQFIGWDKPTAIISGAPVTFTGTWSFVANPIQPPVQTLTVTYGFAFDGAGSDAFDASAVTLPSPHRVLNSNQLILPVTYTGLVTSTDDNGEWQFQGWQVDPMPVNQTLTVVGTWLYKAYELIPQETTYQANPDVAVGTANEVIAPGQAGKRSAFTNRQVQAPVNRIEAVGTKPSVEMTSTDLPVIYRADASLAVGQPNRIDVPGQPTVTTTTITYRLVDGHAVANPPIVETVLGRSEVQLVGTQSTIERIEETPSQRYQADLTRPITASAIVQEGQKGITEKLTTYHLNPTTGQVTADTRIVQLQVMVPTVVLVPAQTTREEHVTDLELIVVTTDDLELGQEQLEVGQPQLTARTVTYTVDPQTGERTAHFGPLEVLDNGRAPILKRGTKQVPSDSGDTSTPLSALDPIIEIKKEDTSNAEEVTSDNKPLSTEDMPKAAQPDLVPSAQVTSQVTPDQSERSSQSRPSQANRRLPETGDRTSLIGLGLLTSLIGLTGLVTKRKQD